MSRILATAGPQIPTVLVTGATGYIGGRLVPVLEGAGVRLRCLARRPAALARLRTKGKQRITLIPIL